MISKFWIVLAFITGSVALSGCAPAVVGAAAVGATGAVLIDEAAEDDGDDGIF